MAKRMPCAGHECGEKAELYLRAFGQKGWAGQLYCYKCAGRIIKLRGKLIKKWKLNVVIRPITDMDRRAK